MYSYSPPLSLPPTLVLPRVSPVSSVLWCHLPRCLHCGHHLLLHWCLPLKDYTCVYCRHVPSDDVHMFSVRTWGPCVQCCPPFLSMQEFFSYGAVSLVTSFFSCFSSSGSLSRTTVAGSTGAMTQVSALGLLQADTLWLYVLSNIRGQMECLNSLIV